MSCGCGGACCSGGSLDPYGRTDLKIGHYIDWPGLGYLGIDANAQAAIAASGQTGRVVLSGNVRAYVPGTSNCSASGISGAARDVGLVGQAGGLALTGAVQTGLITAGPATFGITVAIAGLVGLFSTLFNHHAQAVKKEQNTLCTAVPAANNYLDIIDQAASSGQVDAQHALAALDSLSGDFHSAVSGIYKSCNAACVMQMCLDAAIAAEKQKYQALAQQQQAAAAAQAAAPPQPAAPTTPVTAPPAPSSPAVVPARPNVVSSVPAPGATTSSSYASFYSGAAPAAPPTSALPSWWPVAAAAVVGFLLVRS